MEQIAQNQWKALTPQFTNRSRQYIFDELSACKGVKSVSGLGLMIGVDPEKDASQVITACQNRGVLVIKAKNKVRLLPALNIEWAQLKKAITILKEEIEK